jgi:hypothetical protein
VAGGAPLLPRPHRVPIAHTSQRVTDNVRRTMPNGPDVPEPTPFGGAGPVQAGTSMPWFLPHGYLLDGAEAGVDSWSGSPTDVVLTFKLNGSTVFTLTVPASSAAVISSLGHSVGDYHDKLTIDVSGGVGASGVGGHLRWMPRA